MWRPIFISRVNIVDEGKIKLLASRRASPLSPEGLILPPNIEDLLRDAEHWTISYTSVKGLIEYVAAEITAWPKFDKPVVLHIVDFPQEATCNVICLFRTADVDEQWLKRQAIQVRHSQYLYMAYCEYLGTWHTAVLGLGTGRAREFEFKPGAPTALATMLPEVIAPPLATTDVKDLFLSLGTHFWVTISSLEARGLATRTIKNGEHRIGVLAHDASTARN